jgi:hypothetical protein
MAFVIPSRRVLTKGSKLFRLNPTSGVSRDTLGIGGALTSATLSVSMFVFLDSQIWPFVTFRRRVFMLEFSCSAGYLMRVLF